MGKTTESPENMPKYNFTAGRLIWSRYCRKN